MIKAIVFDLDDTLYPEREFVLSGFHAVAQWASEELGIPARQGYMELECLFIQGIRRDTFNRWLASRDLSVTDNLLREMIRVYRQHEPKIKPFPEVIQLLESLSIEYRLGLVSDGYLEVQKRKLSALSLAHYLDAIVFSDEWGRVAWKPHQKPFQMICHRLQIAPLNAVYIADNPVKDFLGARKMGMKTIWIRRPEGEYSSLQPLTPEHDADMTISTLSKLPEII